MFKIKLIKVERKEGEYVGRSFKYKIGKYKVVKQDKFNVTLRNEHHPYDGVFEYSIDDFLVSMENPHFSWIEETLAIPG